MKCVTKSEAGVEEEDDDEEEEEDEDAICITNLCEYLMMYFWPA